MYKLTMSDHTDNRRAVIFTPSDRRRFSRETGTKDNFLTYPPL